jgi:uncharacterized membrane protein
MNVALVTIELVLVLLLAWVSVEDCIFRAVSWIVYPMLMFAATAYSLQHIDLQQWISHISFNILFVAAQLIFLTAYFSLRSARFVNISMHLIGWGDILFFLSAGLLFAPANYCVFYIVTLILALVAGLFYRLFFARKDRGIPLAGIQATTLAVLLVVSMLSHAVDLTDDTWVMKHATIQER